MSQPLSSGAIRKFAVYTHADTIGAAIVGWLVYRFWANVCFLSPPRLGHQWTLPDGTSMHQVCSNCGKEWWANW